MIKRYKDSPFRQIVYPCPSEDKAGIQHVLAGMAETGGVLRQMARTVLLPGFDMPLHTHDKDQEVYVILSGWAMYNDNGEVTKVGPGDVMYVRAGQSHGIANPFKEPTLLFEINLPDPPK
jgi:mannose-6-phosphate isomerase-like protein (cupin superfamily)